MIFFSVIIPIYNVELYLEEALKSVMAQTYTHFELILVNDGSTDKSFDVAQSFAETDNRVKLISKEKGGASSARNAGLGIALGQYIYFMDSDDVILPNTLQKISDTIKMEKVEAVAFTATPFSDEEYLRTNKLDLNLSLKFYQRGFLAEGKYSGRAYYEQMSNHDNFVASVCMYVFKKDLLKPNSLKFYEGIMMEDELFSRQLFLTCKSLYFLKDSLYNRRIRIGSVSTTNNEAYRIASLLTIAEELNDINKFHQLDVLNKDVKRFFNWTVDGLVAMDKKDFQYKSHLDKLLKSPLLKSNTFNESVRRQLLHQEGTTAQKAWCYLKNLIVGYIGKSASKKDI